MHIHPYICIHTTHTRLSLKTPSVRAVLLFSKNLKEVSQVWWGIFIYRYYICTYTYIHINIIVRAKDDWIQSQ